MNNYVVIERYHMEWFMCHSKTELIAVWAVMLDVMFLVQGINGGAHLIVSKRAQWIFRRRIADFQRCFFFDALSTSNKPC